MKPGHRQHLDEDPAAAGPERAHSPAIMPSARKAAHPAATAATGPGHPTSTCRTATTSAESAASTAPTAIHCIRCRSRPAAARYRSRTAGSAHAVASGQARATAQAGNGRPAIARTQAGRGRRGVGQPGADPAGSGCRAGRRAGRAACAHEIAMTERHGQGGHGPGRLVRPRRRPGRRSARRSARPRRQRAERHLPQGGPLRSCGPGSRRTPRRAGRGRRRRPAGADPARHGDPEPDHDDRDGDHGQQQPGQDRRRARPRAPVPRLTRPVDWDVRHRQPPRSPRRASSPPASPFAGQRRSSSLLAPATASRCAAWTRRAR